jgi:hypothetical protein
VTGVESASVTNLWRQILFRSNRPAFAGIESEAFCGYFKVGKLEISVSSEQDVVGLDIQVDDAFIMDELLGELIRTSTHHRHEKLGEVKLSDVFW